MPMLVFERTRFSIDVPDGARVVDVCDEHFMAGVPFACRHANCGTCRVQVTEGLDRCEGPDDDEWSMLQRLDAAPDERLACMLVVRPGEGTVRLRVTL